MRPKFLCLKNGDAMTDPLVLPMSLGDDHYPSSGFHRNFKNTCTLNIYEVLLENLVYYDGIKNATSIRLIVRYCFVKRRNLLFRSFVHLGTSNFARSKVELDNWEV